MNFPAKLNGKLDLKDKILQIYQDDDLLEVCQMSNLDEEYFLVDIESKKWDFNIFRQDTTYKLVCHEAIQNEKDEWSFSPVNFKNIKLTVE